MRDLRAVCVLAFLAAGFVSVSVRGDTGGHGPETGSADYAPAEWKHKQTDPGPSDATWRRTDLTSAEQAHLDRGAIPDPHAPDTSVGYASAMSELAENARARAAATTLGLDELGSEGVIP